MGGCESQMSELFKGEQDMRNVRLPEFSETPDGEGTDIPVREAVVQQLQGMQGRKFGPRAQQRHHLVRRKNITLHYMLFG